MVMMLPRVALLSSLNHQKNFHANNVDISLVMRSDVLPPKCHFVIFLIIIQPARKARGPEGPVR